MNLDQMSLVALIVAAMMAVKQVPWLMNEARSWLLPWITVVLAVGINCLIVSPITRDVILQGVIYGLTACGLYSATGGAIKGIANNADNALIKRL